MLSLWLVYLALPLGLTILWTEDFDFLLVFLVTAYAGLLLTFARTIRSWRDVFNPLCVILALGFIRFSIPALLLMFGADPEIELFRTMRLHSRDWHVAHVLTLTGLLSCVLGWVLVPGPGRNPPAVRFRLTSGAAHVAVAATGVGFVALMIFVASNIPLVDAIVGGGLRGTIIQVGTGKFFMLGHLLISGTVVLCGYLLSKGKRSALGSLGPVVLATAVLWVLGGRGRAVTPLVGGLLLLWYVRREQSRWSRIRFNHVYYSALLGIPVAIWVGYFGQLYRGGLGLEGVFESLSISGLWRYIQWAIFTDIGHLHPIAGAAVVGPGLLEGTTFVHRLLWPLSQILELPGRSGGVLIVERLVGMGPQKWALGISLIGDAYLNYGIAGIPIVMGLLGSLVKMLYVSFRRGSLHSVVYVLAAWYSVTVFATGIDVWVYAMPVLLSTVLMIPMGRLMDSLSAERSAKGHMWLGNSSGRAFEQT